ncbi:MAG: hypothetical protein AAB865_03150, partial [Patescibacteria group bacterium]
FILATTELHKVPETILSRCQRFDFHRLNVVDIVERLKMIAKGESVKIEDEVLDAIARLSEGCLRDAESLFGQILAIGGDKKITMEEASLVIPRTNISLVLDYLEALSRHQAAEAITVVSKAASDGTRIGPLEDEILEALRYSLLASLGSAPLSSYDKEATLRLVKIAETSGVSQLQQLIQRLLEYRVVFRNDRIPQLPLELLAAEGNISASAAPVSVAPIPTPVVVPKKDSEPEALSPAPQAPSEKPRANASAATVPLDTIKSKWSECCNALMEVSGTLPVILQGVQLLEMDGATLRIGTKIGFIADKLNEPKNRGIIADILSKLVGENVAIMAEVVHQEQDELIADLIGEFGGTVS